MTSPLIVAEFVRSDDPYRRERSEMETETATGMDRKIIAPASPDRWDWWVEEKVREEIQHRDSGVIDGGTAAEIAALWRDEVPAFADLAAGRPASVDELTKEIVSLNTVESLERHKYLLAALDRWVKHVVNKPGEWYAVSGPEGSAVARDVQCLMALAVRLAGEDVQYYPAREQWRAGDLAKALAYAGGGFVRFTIGISQRWLKVEVQ